MSSAMVMDTAPITIDHLSTAMSSAMVLDIPDLVSTADINMAGGDAASDSPVRWQSEGNAASLPLHQTMPMPKRVQEFHPEEYHPDSAYDAMFISKDRADMPANLERVISARGKDTNPFFLVDLADIQRKHLQWCSLLPRVEVCQSPRASPV